MNLVTVCFFFGLFIPTVFIITALSFAFQYIFDRLLITYWFDFPPVYDDLLNLKFVRYLKYAPLVFVPSFLVIVFILSVQAVQPFRKTFNDSFSRYINVGDANAIFGILAGLLVMLILFDLVRFCFKHKL